MLPIEVTRADDPRIGDYVGLSDPELRRRVERDGNFFVAEGPLVVQTLLTTASRVRSVLATPRQYAALAPALASVDAPVYIAAPDIMHATVGFDLHRGIVAAAERAPLPSLDTVLAGARRIAVLEQVNDHENLGGLFRNAAAFGIDAVLLCPQSSDPLYRRAVRVSIGHVLTVPWTRAKPWPAALDALRERGFTIVALTPARDAMPLERFAATIASDTPLAVLVGAEGPGLTAAALARSHERVRIPMTAAVDSVNVSVAAAIAFARLAPSDRLT